VRPGSPTGHDHTCAATRRFGLVPLEAEPRDPNREALLSLELVRDRSRQVRLGALEPEDSHIAPFPGDAQMRGWLRDWTPGAFEADPNPLPEDERPPDELDDWSDEGEQRRHAAVGPGLLSYEEDDSSNNDDKGVDLLQTGPDDGCAVRPAASLGLPELVDRHRGADGTRRRLPGMLASGRGVHLGWPRVRSARQRPGHGQDEGWCAD
jgi:hypothetical protein